jgi:hypothetical protein
MRRQSGQARHGGEPIQVILPKQHLGTDDSRGIDGTRSVIFLAGCFPEVVGREWESGTQAKSRGNKTLALAAPRSIMAAWARQPYFYKPYHPSHNSSQFSTLHCDAAKFNIFWRNNDTFLSDSLAGCSLTLRVAFRSNTMSSCSLCFSKPFTSPL